MSAIAAAVKRVSEAFVVRRIGTQVVAHSKERRKV